MINLVYISTLSNAEIFENHTYMYVLNSFGIFDILPLH